MKNVKIIVTLVTAVYLLYYPYEIVSHYDYGHLYNTSAEFLVIGGFLWLCAFIYIMVICKVLAFIWFLIKRKFKGNGESSVTGPVVEHMQDLPVNGKHNQVVNPPANGLTPLARARKYHRARRGVVASNATGRERYPLFADLYIDRDLTCGEEQAFFNDFGMHPDTWMEVWCPMREMTMEKFFQNCASNIIAIAVFVIALIFAINSNGGVVSMVLWGFTVLCGFYLLGSLTEVKVEFLPPDEITNTHDAYAARYALFVGYRRALRQAQESGDPMGLAGILQNALTRLRFSPPESYYRFVSWSPSSQQTAATPSPFDSVHVPFDQIHKVEPVADLPPTHPLYVPESDSYTESVTVRGDKVDDFVSDLISASVPFKPYGSGVKVPTSHLSTAQMLAMKYQF